MTQVRTAREPLFVDTVLARRLELAEAEGGASCGFSLAREKPESGAAVETIAGGRAVFTGIGSPITQATGIGLNRPVTPDEFARLENFFFSRGAAVNVETSPYADATLFAHYAKNGYCAMEFTSVLVRRVEKDERVGGKRQSGDWRSRDQSERRASVTLMRAARAAGRAEATTAAARRTSAEATTGAALGICMSLK